LEDQEEEAYVGGIFVYQYHDKSCAGTERKRNTSDFESKKCPSKSSVHDSIKKGSIYSNMTNKQTDNVVKQTNMMIQSIEKSK